MYEFDFALSFAGEDRDKAKELADKLKKGGANVFYDEDFQAELWGKDLYQNFQEIYGKKSKFFIPFISQNYIDKNWPKHELKQAQARDFKSNDEYILPLRLDDTSLPGLNETTGYIDLRTTSIVQVACLCLEKLSGNLVGSINPNISNEMRLYHWLKEHNPESISALKLRPGYIVIRVSTGSANQLKKLLEKINPQICQGRDSQDMISNGGVGPPGCISSKDPEPHTKFQILFSQSFFDKVLS